MIRITHIIVFCVLFSRLLFAEDVEHKLAAARQSLQTGRYDEAIDAFREQLSGDNKPEVIRDATLGLSHALEARGLADMAAEVVRDGSKRLPADADLLARQAELLFRRGAWKEAERTAVAALQLDENQLLAHLIQAHVWTETGRFDEAVNGYRWFVRYYNRAQPTDSQDLLLVAEGSLQYARWKSVSAIFDFVINTLCPDALEDDPHCWQAAHLSGKVLLEKYNPAQGVPELEAALVINPRAAEVFVSRGEAALQESELEQAIEFAQQALDVNPRLPSGLRLAAEVSLVSGDLEAAKKFIEPALAVNPRDQSTLAQQAAVFLLEDGLPDLIAFRGELLVEDAAKLPNVDVAEQTSRFERLWGELTAMNPTPGVFLTELGELLDSRRKYAAAEVCYRKAIEVMPQLSAPRNELGLLLMRTGKLKEAAEILDAAFKADPYHVRVSNMRKVIRQLVEYDSITSDHFVIRVPEDERILGEEMSRYLEQTYDELTAMYGFEPETRTQFEIFGDANGQSAHQWFSARMVGLPWVQTIGASTGMIVAMASPHDQSDPFNWARVARHEFVHILTLQQTEFNIPHWYTEALAVRTEGTTPESWDALLLERVAAGEVFTLADINSGFTRPSGPTDWNMAYCQSWLYAQYIAERFGESSLFGLTDAYRRNLSTPDAIAEVCGIDLEEFEQGHADYVAAYVKEIRRNRVPPPLRVATAAKLWKQHPEDHAAWADFAWALWHMGEQQQAREMATEIHAAAPTEPLAVAILAESELEKDRVDEAETLLQTVFDPDDPHPAILERMALVEMKQENWPAARDFLEQGVQRWSREPKFQRGLAATLLQINDDTRLQEILTMIAEQNADEGLVRKKLARMAAEEEDWTSAIQWGEEALHCDVRDAAMHRLLAEAYERTGEDEAASRHTELAQRLDAMSNE